MHTRAMIAVGLVAFGLVSQARLSGDKALWSEAARTDALSRAIVWQEPATPLERANLSRTPDALPDEFACRFHVDDLNGLTPKFECALRGGEIVKVKYTGAEPHGEVAATRLLRAIGFGADNVSFARKVRCYGCPRFPYPTMKAVALVGAERLFERGLDYDSALDFEWAAVERKSDVTTIQTPSGKGWAWHELARVPTASRVHADALTLMAVFLAHWDNKAENQRLVCLSGAPRPDGTCARPLAMMQDVGGTFGPRKVDLASWRKAPIWEERTRCSVSMASLPHGGATFVPIQISERGRRFLADRLGRLSEPQITALFESARFSEHDGTTAEWVEAFKARVTALATGPACPKP